MWKEFRQEIQQLNKNAPDNVQYKVFFLARHGQAMHVCNPPPVFSFFFSFLAFSRYCENFKFSAADIEFL
jgi:hypothetical protein